ncbi:TonB-dependent receptor [Sphingomonas profundi]|uniref:TonB-dependent receptor n=1 Tax=Alterirhizorhabdus profundi TaxID=2681549 RepID=UPI001E54869D|nr:TonB-dependent receptor [Sphingomonas profundi]
MLRLTDFRRSTGMLVGLSSLATALAASPAHAQTASPLAAAANGDTIGDIVVTASRREEFSRDVPIAVTALSGENLAAANSSGLDIRFLSARTPSLLIESSFGRTFPRFYIRGLGNTDFDPNVAQPVAIYYDDVVLENPFLKSFPVFDVSAVQVLRGPQGTLFGRNSPAGVVKIDSVKPSDTFNGYGTVSYGTFDTVNAEAAVGGPVANGLTFRLSGILQRRSDWVTNDSTSTNDRSPDKLEGYRDTAGRFQLGYESGDFKALFNIHGRDERGTARLFRAASLVPGTNRFKPDFDVKHVTLDADNDQRLKSWGTNLHLEYALDGIGTLYSVTGYERLKIFTTSDIDGGDRYAFFTTPPNALPTGVAEFPVETGNRTRPKEFSQELRFATEDMNGLRLQAGAYYFKQKLYYEEYDNQPGSTSPAGSIADGTVYGLVTHDNTNENYGVFGSAEYQATEALSLRAGVRYSHDKKHDFTNRVTNPSENVFPPMTFDVRVSDSNVSFDASATYKLSEEVNVYARVATGYQGPAIEDRVTFDSSTSTAPSEKALSGEIGIKTSLFDKKARFDLTGYWYRVKDFQQTSVGGGANTANLISIDKVEGYGVEVDFEARPIERLQITAGGSYNHTEIKDPGLDVGVCGGGCTVLDPLAANGNALINGNPLPQAQKWIATGSVRYGVPIGEDNEVFAMGDLAFRSSANIFLYDSIEFRTRPFTELGARVGFRTASQFEIAGFVRNVLDQIRVTSAVDFNNITTMVNEPRTFGISISKRF